MKRVPLAPVTKAGEFSDTFRKALNFAQHADLSITPMDVMFDLLDGSVGYTGPNFRIFKKK